MGQAPWGREPAFFAAMAPQRIYIAGREGGGRRLLSCFFRRIPHGMQLHEVGIRAILYLNTYVYLED